MISTSIPPVVKGVNNWIRVGALIDGSAVEPLKDAHLVYNDKTIVYVGRQGELPPKKFLKDGQQMPDAELEDYTLLPGLIEAHAHLFLEGGELDFERRKAYLKKSNDELFELALKRCDKLVKIGVLGVRDAGDRNGVGLALSRLYKQGSHPLMPYIESPGAAIHHRGRYGSFMADPIEEHASARECVESRIRAGADRIKLIPTGIIDFKAGAVTKEPQMTLEEVRTITNLAKKQGFQSFAHASGADGIENVIEGGVDSVEHGFFVRVDQLGRMRDRQIAWVPTFAPVQKQVDLKTIMGYDEKVSGNLQRILDHHAASLRKAHAMGVLIVAGSDAGSYAVAHGTGFLYELELMEKAGLPTLEVINAATGVSSGRFGYHEKIGRIVPGYKSRFILTQYSPLKGISNLRKNKFIVFDGGVYDSPENADLAGL
jgi:imidazolonepropionase-like amidohydrolase